ncbi:uncharacterized protein LOC123514390 [Portunus trituberculatus]|uniref:uncharacterized protein LOC123514390 n=1 Tax=Portunus trituberculatus TaxID=210409 RepID=UPI001E1CE822|nr:uncharacterized protein LOC123514390 [Portunus trituberculatus]
MPRKCVKCFRSLPSLTVDPHEECLSCREVFCSLASHSDCCKALSHDQFLRFLDSIKDRTEKRKASSSGKRKSSPSSQQLHKRMCKMEETLGRLSLFLSSSQGSPFSGFQSLASQVDDSHPGTSRLCIGQDKRDQLVPPVARLRWYQRPPQTQTQQVVPGAGGFC